VSFARKTLIILLSSTLFVLQGCSLPTLVAGAALGVVLGSSSSLHKEWRRATKKYL
jgi:hypothetical protein